MKTINCVAFLFAVLAANDSDAAIVNLTRELGSRTMNFGSPLIRSGLFFEVYGSLNSITKSFTTSVDTAADTGSFTDMQFGVALIGGGTNTRTVTTVTPPTDFPNPPIITTATYTESVTFDPISPANLAPQLLSSTVGSISYARDFVYAFPTGVMIDFPDSFTLSGTYQFQGPTQMATVPFSVEYSRTTSEIVTSPWLGFISVGTGFPDTAVISALSGASAIYSPATRTIYSGTVEGRPFSVQLQNTMIVAQLPIPEPMSVCILAIGVFAWWGQAMRRRSLCERRRRE